MCPAHYHLFEIYGSLGIRRQNGNPRCMGCDTDMCKSNPNDNLVVDNMPILY